MEPHDVTEGGSEEPHDVTKGGPVEPHVTPRRTR